MENENLMDILKKLIELPYDSFIKEIEQYTLKTLEHLIIKIYEDYPIWRMNKKNNIFSYFKNNEVMHLYDTLLSERKAKKDKYFKLTGKNKNKLLMVNKYILDVFEKAYNEAISVANELENRITNNDDFLNDYEIEIEINFYNGDDYDGFDSIGYVLSEPISDACHPIKYSIGHDDFLRRMNYQINFDDSYDWNDALFGFPVTGNDIVFTMHRFFSHSNWSYTDILNIKRIWADVKVTRQHFKDI